VTMTARLALLGAVCAASAAVAASIPAAGGATRTVYVDGDSLAVGTTLFLPKYLRGWRLQKSINVSRHAYEGLAPIRARGSALERVLIVDLGTNDDPSRVSIFNRSVREIMAAVGPKRCVIWPTIHRPPYRGISWEGFNRELRRLGRRYDNLVVYDWAATARAHPKWFGADGVHPSMNGYRVRAAALAKLVKAC
jgi:hypothetical protein